MKISPVGAELFHADVQAMDGRTERQTWRGSIFVFHNFANASKKCDRIFMTSKCLLALELLVVLHLFKVFLFGDFSSLDSSYL
jgi:hypothetical protein